VCALVSIGAWPLVAQTSTQRGIVQGTVIDSVRGGVLAGAYVELVPSGRQVPTTANGFFRFDNVPSGEPFHLRVMHARLDTLGVALTTPRFAVTEGEAKTIDVSLPPASTIVQSLCTPATLLRGPAALVGFVRDPDTGAPIDSASVSLVYDDSPTALVRSMTTRQAIPDASGRFVICGLPARMTGHLELTHKGKRSAEIPLSINGDSPLVLRALGVSRDAKRDARLVGRVVTKRGEPVSDARIEMDQTTSFAISTTDGRFVLDSVPTGTQLVRARKIGYSMTEHPADVARGGEPITIVMADAVKILPTVVTRADRAADLAAVGFTRRKAQGLGFFLEGDQIDKGPPTLGESLRMIPGLRVGYDAQNQRAQKTIVMSSRDSRTCVRYVLDGVLFQEVGGDIEKLVRPSDIEALEMYNPSTVPGEFAAASRGRCSVLVVWTKQRVRSSGGPAEKPTGKP
jgi:hypothetical protein